jgi:2-amino-4-hydroxy-6-hydroxymethyldihydropteridine diphosphokinase
MQTVLLLLGSNLGDRAGNLGNAVSKLDEKIGSILCSSSLYESEPWGMNSVNNFYNQCISLTTSMDPVNVLGHIHNIEREMGKEETSGNYEDRTIDIDILFFGDQVVNDPGLIIPHPRIRNRRFAMIPLLEIYPDFIYPPTGERLQAILDSCKDTLSVWKIH